MTGGETDLYTEAWRDVHSIFPPESCMEKRYEEEARQFWEEKEKELDHTVDALFRMIQGEDVT